MTHIGLEAVRSGFSLDGGRVFTFDAVSDADMQNIISAAKATGKRTLYIGTAAMADNIMTLESTIPLYSGLLQASATSRAGRCELLRRQE